MSERTVLLHSLERIINTSMRLARHVLLDESTHPDLADLADVNLDDWERCKADAVRLWNAEQQAILRHGPQE